MPKKDFIIRLDAELLAQIDATGKPRGTVMKEALLKYLNPDVDKEKMEQYHSAHTLYLEEFENMKQEIIEAIEKNSINPNDIVLPIQQNLNLLQTAISNKFEQNQINYGELKNAVTEHYLKSIASQKVIETKTRTRKKKRFWFWRR